MTALDKTSRARSPVFVQERSPYDPRVEGWIVLALVIGLPVLFVVAAMRWTRQPPPPPDLHRADELEEPETPGSKKELKARLWRFYGSGMTQGPTFRL